MRRRGYSTAGRHVGRRRRRAVAALPARRRHERGRDPCVAGRAAGRAPARALAARLADLAVGDRTPASRRLGQGRPPRPPERHDRLDQAAPLSRCAHPHLGDRQPDQPPGGRDARPAPGRAVPRGDRRVGYADADRLVQRHRPRRHRQPRRAVRLVRLRPVGTPAEPSARLGRRRPARDPRDERPQLHRPGGIGRMPARLTRRPLPAAQPGAAGDAGGDRQARRPGVADGDANERHEGPAAAGGRRGRADRPAGMGGDAGRPGAAAAAVPTSSPP